MDKNYSISSKKAHPLLKVWNAYPQSLSNTAKSITTPPTIEQIIGELFSIGEFYYYSINVPESTLMFTNGHILKIHGLKKLPKYLKEIIDLIHPDDLDFVMEAERMTLEKMNEIGWEHQQNLKCSYCFRMRTWKGNYEMFHHQSLHIAKDEDGKLLQAVNIHTNIQHITTTNSHIVLVAGVGNRDDFHQMHYEKTEQKQLPDNSLTKREIEILSLLALGNSAKQISDILDLSYHTVTTHRRNIFQKTDCTKISELIKKALEWGLI
ncbi:helix-turn-helix transcriptional regulator [Epilithonimonas zeae]|uniref:helix-turn-helix transcriptional regulator n=1 Tax=Epilithonimonas zeae TaxID=1416779 RepID=UPI00200BAE65|nr:helix-turn-helix transcriptional regulator [Epilithonimonas zeae]UQB69994.1 helix-turn-helix transcriptional regulator [Epilithonimonas zeae]